MPVALPGPVAACRRRGRAPAASDSVGVIPAGAAGERDSDSDSLTGPRTRKGRRDRGPRTQHGTRRPRRIPRTRTPWHSESWWFFSGNRPGKGPDSDTDAAARRTWSRMHRRWRPDSEPRREVTVTRPVSLPVSRTAARGRALRFRSYGGSVACSNRKADPAQPRPPLRKRHSESPLQTRA